jgi:outer membrane receptor for ferrienterochelin and colicins
MQRYINKGNLTTQGFEMEGKAVVSSAISINGSFTYQTSVNENDAKDIYGMPKIMGKIGFNYAFGHIANVGIFNSYFGKGGSINIYDTNGALKTKYVNPQANAYNHMTVNFSLNLTELFNLKNGPGISLSGYMKNVLNEEIYYPEVVRRNINSLPGRPERSVYFGVNVKL